MEGREGFPLDPERKGEHDAYVVAAFIRDADSQGRLRALLEPRLNPAEESAAEIEGWILGAEQVDTR